MIWGCTRPWYTALVGTPLQADEEVLRGGEEEDEDKEEKVGGSESWGPTPCLSLSPLPQPFSCHLLTLWPVPQLCVRRWCSPQHAEGGAGHLFHGS